jgi:hypothetical protein
VPAEVIEDGEEVQQLEEEEAVAKAKTLIAAGCRNQCDSFCSTIRDIYFFSSHSLISDKKDFE